MTHSVKEGTEHVLVNTQRIRLNDKIEFTRIEYQLIVILRDAYFFAPAARGHAR